MVTVGSTWPPDQMKIPFRTSIPQQQGNLQHSLSSRPHDHAYHHNTVSQNSYVMRESYFQNQLTRLRDVNQSCLAIIHAEQIRNAQLEAHLIDEKERSCAQTWVWHDERKALLRQLNECGSEMRVYRLQRDSVAQEYKALKVEKFKTNKHADDVMTAYEVATEHIQFLKERYQDLKRTMTNPPGDVRGPREEIVRIEEEMLGISSVTGVTGCASSGSDRPSGEDAAPYADSRPSEILAEVPPTAGIDAPAMRSLGVIAESWERGNPEARLIEEWVLLQGYQAPRGAQGILRSLQGRDFAVLGQGAFGTVYGVDGYAIKSAEASNRWEQMREMLAHACIGTHSNIVGIAAMDPRMEGYPIVMTRAAGTLKELLHKKTPKMSTLLRVVRDASKGIAFMHEQGVVNNDVKPQNILVSGRTASSVVGLVADLGLAEVVGATQGRLGTTNYIPPEALYDEVRAAPSRDVFALGATLAHVVMLDTYKLLFLNKANVTEEDFLRQRVEDIPMKHFQVEMAYRNMTADACIHRVLQSSNVERSVANPDDVCAFIKRMVAQKPEDRPTMHEVITGLDTLMRAQEQHEATESVRHTSAVGADGRPVGADTGGLVRPPPDLEAIGAFPHARGSGDDGDPASPVTAGERRGGAGGAFVARPSSFMGAAASARYVSAGGDGAAATPMSVGGMVGKVTAGPRRLHRRRDLVRLRPTWEC